MPSDRTYTVKQAAAILGVAEMTIRRQAKAGDLPAVRAGRSWLVEAAAVDRRAAKARRLATSAKPRLDFDASLRQIIEARRHSWIPDPLDFKDVVASPRALLAVVSGRWESSATDGRPYEVVPVPKTKLLHRPGARLDLDDEVLYQALVLKASPKIAQHLTKSAIGHRPASSGRELTESPSGEWSQYQKILRDSPHAGSVALRTDIAAYFEQIKTPILRDVLLGIGVHPDVVGGVQGLLTGWERTTGLSGLPQGGEASRVLANIYLMAADAAIETACHANGWQYVRWMDDITIFANSERDVARAAFLLEAELHRLGLNLSSAKTSVQSTANVAAKAADPILGQIDYAFRLRRLNDVKTGAWNVLQAATSNFRTLDPEAGTSLRFALYRLGETRDSRAIPFLIRHLGEAGFLAPFAYLYLRNFASDRRVSAGIGSTLAELDHQRNGYLAAHLMRILYRSSQLDAVALEETRAIAWSTTASPSVRALAIRVVGRHASPVDTLRLRERLWLELADVCVRAILAALREADPRGHRSVLGDFRRLHGRFGPTVDYLLSAPAPGLT